MCVWGGWLRRCVRVGVCGWVGVGVCVGVCVCVGGCVGVCVCVCVQFQMMYLEHLSSLSITLHHSNKYIQHKYTSIKQSSPVFNAPGIVCKYLYHRK